MDEVERLERDAARASALAGAREGFLKTISDIDSNILRLDADIGLLRTKREKASEYRDLEKNEKAAREKADGLRKRKDRIGELLAKMETLAAEGSRFPGSIAQGTPASLDELRIGLEREALLEKEIESAGSGSMTRAPRWRPVLAAVLILAGAVGIAIHKPLDDRAARRRRRAHRLAFRAEAGPRRGRCPSRLPGRARAALEETEGVVGRSLSRRFEGASRGMRRMEGARARRRIEGRRSSRRPAGRSGRFRRSSRPRVRGRRSRASSASWNRAPRSNRSESTGMGC